MINKSVMAYFEPKQTKRVEIMDKTNIGKTVVVFVSEDRGQTKTVKGKIVEVNDNLFVIVDPWGNKSQWNEQLVRGIRYIKEKGALENE